jgi:hypothetical protein
VRENGNPRSTSLCLKRTEPLLSGEKVVNRCKMVAIRLSPVRFGAAEPPQTRVTAVFHCLLRVEASARALLVVLAPSL